MGSDLKICAIVIVLLFGFAWAAPKPLDFDEIGRKFKDFGNKVMPAVKGTCGVINSISAINDQMQGTPQNQGAFQPQFPQFNPQYPQFNPQYPQFNPQYPIFNPQYPQFPQFNPNLGSQNPAISPVSPAVQPASETPLDQADSITESPSSSENSTPDAELKELLQAVFKDQADNLTS